MKLNLNQETSIANSFKLARDLAPNTHTIWWQKLSQEKKEKICRLNVSDIMSDLANAANNALVVCKLNHTYKKKDLISWTKYKNQDDKVVSQSFEFSFVDKEVLDDCWAKLFSCFYIFVSKHQKQPSQSQTESHIGVKQGRLDSILDFLSHSICNFEEGGNRPVFQKKTQLSELYFSLVDESSERMNFSSSLPTYLKVLFERLAAYSFLLEHQILSTYIEENASILDQALISETEGIQQPTKNKLVPLAPIVTTSSIVFKTVTQLEKELSNQEPNVDQNSTASGSPKNPIVIVAAASLNIEELNQKLLQKSPKMPRKFSTVSEISFSDSSCESKIRLTEEIAQENIRKNSSGHSWNEMLGQSTFVYEGCYVGNLQMTFDIMDPQLMGEDENIDPDYEKEEREFGILKYEDIFEVCTPENEQESENEEYQSNSNDFACMQASFTSFNMIQNPIINYPAVYPIQQQFSHVNQEFYSPYYSVQQTQPIISQNYVNPTIYPTAINQNEFNYQQTSYTTENPNFGYFTNYPAWNSHLNYQNEENYYQKQKTEEHNTNHYAAQDEKTYFNAGKDKPRYDTRPKLPPRLQKRKENMIRT